jgi:hypothetical protein
MNASTTEQILVALCREAGTDSVGMTKTEVWDKLRTVSAKTKKAAALEIGAMFGFDEEKIQAVQCGLWKHQKNNWRSFEEPDEQKTKIWQLKQTMDF